MGVSEKMGALVAAEEYAAEQERLGELMRQVNGCHPSVLHKWPLLALSYRACASDMGHPCGFLTTSQLWLFTGLPLAGPKQAARGAGLVRARGLSHGDRTHGHVGDREVGCVWWDHGSVRSLARTLLVYQDHLLPFWLNLVPDG